MEGFPKVCWKLAMFSIGFYLQLKIPPKKLSEGPSAIMRPLNNSNMSKVLITKLSHSLNFLSEVSFMAY